MVWLPTLLSVTFKVAEPPKICVSEGRTALGSELVKCTVPMYEVAWLPLLSTTVIVKPNGTPVLTKAGVEKTTRGCAYAQVEPLRLASVGPPTNAVLESAESATEKPWLGP